MALQHVLAVLAALGGALLLWAGRRSLGLASRVVETPVRRIRDLRSETVALQARIKDAPDLLESPLTRRRCVYFRFEVREQRMRPRRRDGGWDLETVWHPVVKDERYAACRVSDGSGAVRLDLRQATLRLRASARLRVDRLHPPAPWLAALLEGRYGYSLRGFCPQVVRLEESALFVGEQIYVLGHADVGAQEARIVPGQTPLLVSDRDPARLARELRFEGAAWILFGVLALGLASWIELG